MKYYFAACFNLPSGRCGVVFHGTERQMDELCPRHRIGYVGETDLQTAVKRAGMMERDEPNAWGVIS